MPEPATLTSIIFYNRKMKILLHRNIYITVRATLTLQDITLVLQRYLARNFY